MRAALVTGGGTGIGRATALRLARDGYAVAVAGRRAAPLEEVARAIDGLAVPGDHADEADAERRMLESDGDRAIVNVASTLAHTAAPGVAPYAAAKGGVLALTRALAIEYGPHGIRVNAVCPHIVETALAEVDRPNWAELRERLPAEFPLGRLGRPRTSRPRSPGWPRRKPLGDRPHARRGRRIHRQVGDLQFDHR